MRTIFTDLALIGISVIALPACCFSQAPTAERRPITFADSEYIHRFSEGGLHEYTPPTQDDLSQWTDMVTLTYWDLNDSKKLAQFANAVLADYKAAGGKIVDVDSVPRTEEKPAEHYIIAAFHRPEFAEVVFARFVINDGVGISIIYSHRSYGDNSREEVGTWFKKNANKRRQSLLEWDDFPNQGIPN